MERHNIIDIEKNEKEKVTVVHLVHDGKRDAICTKACGQFG